MQNTCLIVHSKEDFSYLSFVSRKSWEKVKPVTPFSCLSPPKDTPALNLLTT